MRERERERAGLRAIAGASESLLPRGSPPPPPATSTWHATPRHSMSPHVHVHVHVRVLSMSVSMSMCVWVWARVAVRACVRERCVQDFKDFAKRCVTSMCVSLSKVQWNVFRCQSRISRSQRRSADQSVWLSEKLVASRAGHRFSIGKLRSCVLFGSSECQKGSRNEHGRRPRYNSFVANQ